MAADEDKLLELRAKAFLLLGSLNDIEVEASNLQNELREMGVLEDMKKTMKRVHGELLESGKAIVDKLNGENDGG